jgi:hypothetical protein
LCDRPIHRALCVPGQERLDFAAQSLVAPARIRKVLIPARRVALARDMKKLFDAPQTVWVHRAHHGPRPARQCYFIGRRA